MDDEERIEKVRCDILRSFDSWAYHHLLRVYPDSSLSQREWMKKCKEAALQAQFGLRSSMDPAFYRHILRETKRSSVRRRQRGLLIEMLLRTIVLESGVSNKDVVQSFSKTRVATGHRLEISKNRYSRRHNYRIIKRTYADLFIEPDPAHRMNENDRRVRKYGSIFSLPDDSSRTFKGTSEKHIRVSEIIEESKALVASPLGSVLSVGSHTHLLLPERWEELLDFVDRAKYTLAFISENERLSGHDRTMMAFMRSELRTSSPLIGILSSVLSDEIHRTWFESQEHREQVELIREKMSLDLTSQDIRDSYRMACTFYGRNDLAQMVLLVSSDCLQSIGLLRDCITAKKTLLEICQLSCFERGMEEATIAQCAFDLKDYPSARWMLLRARDSFRQGRHKAEMLAVRAFLALIEVRQSNFEKAVKLMDEVEEDLRLFSELSERFDTILQIPMLCREATLLDHERRILSLFNDSKLSYEQSKTLSAGILSNEREIRTRKKPMSSI